MSKKVQAPKIGEDLHVLTKSCEGRVGEICCDRKVTVLLFMEKRHFPLFPKGDYRYYTIENHVHDHFLDAIATTHAEDYQLPSIHASTAFVTGCHSRDPYFTFETQKVF